MADVKWKLSSKSQLNENNILRHFCRASRGKNGYIEFALNERDS